jgi:CHAD domain-containing protein
MKRYVQQQIAARIAKLALQARRAVESADADSVHDLRVAIRRLSSALKAFADCLPAKAAKRVRRELSELMDKAAEVRNRDITIELLEKAGVLPRARVMTTLSKERLAAAEALQTELREWRKRNAVRQWKGALEL